MKVSEIECWRCVVVVGVGVHVHVSGSHLDYLCAGLRLQKDVEMLRLERKEFLADQ